MSENYVLKEHREWITSLQPVGLVVSANALEHAQLRLQKDVFEAQETFKSLLDPNGQLLPLHVVNLFTRFLGWRQEDLASGDETRDLQTYLPERETLLKPDYAVRNIDTDEFDILIKYVDSLQFDANEEVTGRAWDASPHTKFERLLREKNISLGILINNNFLRIVYAPKGETSGYMTFPFAFMREVQGRPILAGLKLLLGEDRLFKGDPKQRLQYLLTESRKFQNDVSTKLSQQVLAALYELVRGFQTANEETKGELLKDVLKEDKNEVYHGLLTVLLRTVFTLYAEDRDLISSDPVFLNNYSINGLFTKLREDFSKYHDSMDLRYGAWAHLLSLYRLIYEGIELETDSIPGRKGHLFDPDRFPFLEGRTTESPHFNPPKISDGVVWRVLEKLMTLDGERISYRALDVEQIGSVYETVMGFQLELAASPSIAINPSKTHGAPIIINLSSILSEKPEKRIAKLKEITDHKLDGKTGDAVKKAKSPNELVTALGRKVAEWATPSIVEPGAIVLQPSDERRRSGSHYTPRALTAPVVSKALEPVLRNLGSNPKPEQILNLKICDPAMGSGAFLVETCRQLSEVLVKSWSTYTPKIREEIPPDEDELLYARRLIAQRCLYGVDKNPMAVSLAKLSLWLATFAKLHDFTFLDHCLKCGDSLVGLQLNQILGATWFDDNTLPLVNASIHQRLTNVQSIRTQILTAEEGTPTNQLRVLKAQEDRLLSDLRNIGDAVIFSFFKREKTKERKDELNRVHLLIEGWFASGLPFSEFHGLDSELHWLRENLKIHPFHWHCEFPEIFYSSEQKGFDAFIGNPPFAGKNNLVNSSPSGYLDWLLHIHKQSNGNADLSAHFFRRAYSLLKEAGTIGFIATNTIAQGDTRSTGLGWIACQDGHLYNVNRRIKWPGQAAVIVSTVHISKVADYNPKHLDNDLVPTITSFFLVVGGDQIPSHLQENKNKSFKGAVILGPGFTFDDSRLEEGANPISDLKNLNLNQSERALIKPYIGGEEVNDSSTHSHRRFAIDFQDMPLIRAQKGTLWGDMDDRTRIKNTKLEEAPPDFPFPVAEDFPTLLKIVKERVKPNRDKDKRESRKKYWWRFGETVPALRNAISSLENVIVCSQRSKHICFTLLQSNMIFDQTLVVIASESFTLFATLQSRVHEIWARFLGSTMKDDPTYTPSDCFETFPFPKRGQIIKDLEDMGREYFEFRGQLMKKYNEGLTKVYNRFHSPSVTHQDIVQLRNMHHKMDRAILDAYGWTDINPSPLFLPDYIDETGSAPVRLRWPDDVRDLILGRLIELNTQYSENQELG